MRLVTVASALGAAAAASQNAPVPVDAGAGPATAVCSGPVDVLLDGQLATWQLVRGQYAQATANGSDISVYWNDRAYIVSECSSGSSGGVFTPEMYATKWSLLGKQLNYTVDLSTASCGCNVALYAVSMPGVDSNGNPVPSTSGDYYCDANDVGGTWCPECDVMEANVAALQVTPHDCAAPNANGWYPSCDRGGCGQNTFRNAGVTSFGPGASFGVDTTQPFTVSTSWPADPVSGNLTAMTTTLHQAGKAPITLSHTDATCGAGYLASFGPALKAGMVPTLSVWGDASSGTDMKWLDAPPCDVNQGCAGNGVVARFSGISLATLPS